MMHVSAAAKARAHIVDAMIDVRGMRLEDELDHGERDQAERQIDIEDPAP